MTRRSNEGADIGSVVGGGRRGGKGRPGPELKPPRNQRAGVSDGDHGPSARAALRAALADRRRHGAALALVALAAAGALLVDTPTARYGAVLFAFAVWMGWFVLTAVEWIRRAEF